jgi:hypothetical protein
MTNASQDIPMPAPPVPEALRGYPLGNASHMCGALLGSVVQGQAELFRFLSRRLVKDADMLHQLAACRTPADVMQLQLRLGTDAAADYLSETQRMIEVLEKAASENLALIP